MFVADRINKLFENEEKELKSNNPKILRKMNTYLRNLFVYFENVLHPASGWSENNSSKKRKSSKKATSLQISPECYNIRGAKKKDELRRNPAP